ncbi:unnamed protein product, partial [Brassica rapa subsp. narinosa]
MAKKKPPKKPAPTRNSPSSSPLKVSVPPIEDPVPEFIPATVLDLPSPSLGNTDCEVTLSPSLPTELDVHLDLVSDAEPPSSETLATVSCDVPVVKEGTAVLAVQASAEKVTIVSSSVPEQSITPVTSSVPDQTKAPSASVEQAKSPAEIWKGFKLGHTISRCKAAPRTCAACNSVRHTTENCPRGLNLPPKDKGKAPIKSLLPIVSLNKRESTPKQVYREIQKKANVPSHSVLARDSVANAAAVIKEAETNKDPSSVSKDGLTVTTVHDLNIGQLYVDLSGSP